jgi:hypothetical protein
MTDAKGYTHDEARDFVRQYLGEPQIFGNAIPQPDPTPSDESVPFPNPAKMNGGQVKNPPVDRTGTVKLDVNREGGASSALDVRMDLIPGELLRYLGNIFAFGVNVRGYDPGNWKKVEGWKHINHALAHIATFQEQRTRNLGPELAGDDEDHLAHAFWRLGAALWARDHRGLEDMYDGD